MSLERPTKELSAGQPDPEVIRDAVEHLQSALEECEARFERLVESSPDIIYRMRARPDLRFEYINSAAERILGYPRERFLEGGFELMQSIIVDDQTRRETVEAAAGRTFFPVRLMRVRRADGKLISIEIHNVPVYDETGALVAQEGTVRDVTDREEALAYLRASEQQMRHLMEALPDLTMRVDDSGTFAEHVRTASTQPARHFLGKTIDEVLPPESRAVAQSALQKALAGTPRSFRSRISMYGVERSYEICLVPTTSGDLLALLRDVTDEEWAAGEEQRREARSKLENTVDHQLVIRNPYHLTFREFTVLHLMARGAADKEIANELGIANSTVNRHVSNILGKMGAASRTEAGVRAVQEGLAKT